MKTLKYATHARGIANKPTVTKNVVRADIVNSMQAEIDKLRLDLQAARDRQGFHMTRDTYESLTEGAAQAQAKAEEWKQRVDLLETGLDKARADTETMDKRIDQLEHDKAAAAEALRESQAQQQQLAELLRAESLFTRAHAHHEQEVGMAARQLRSDLAQARSEGALLHAKTVRLAEREQRNVDTAVCVSRQAQTDADNILAQASALGARAADNVGALLAALESRIGSDLERTLALHIGTHTSKLRTELERVAETYRGESEPKTDSIRAALEAADALAAGVQSAVEAAANDVSSACTASAADAQTFHSQLNEQWITLATAVRQIVGPAQSDGEAALREAETRNDQHAQQIRGDSLEQQQRAAEHIAALEQQVEALQAKALQDDESTLHAFAQMLAQRREGSAAMSSAIIQRVAADVDARNSMTQSLIGRFDESAKGHTFAAKTLLAGTAAAHDAIIQRVAGCANAAKASVGALVRSTDDRCAHIQTRLAIALHAAADARAEAVAKHVVIRQEFGALGKAGESAMQLASTAATEAADRYYGTTELVVSAIGSARGEMGDLAETQTAEIKSAVAAISANIANVATTVQRGLAEGVQALESSGQTPTRLAAQRSPASWNVTLPHDTILARLPANEHADRLDWTGEPACWDEVVMADAESMTDVEPMDVARPATPDAAPRKRPSDSAISPHADVASQRPTRRPRTRAALDHSDSATVDENDPPAAALTPPAEPDLRLASAIPMPRRARRARN
ncbi:hypothetical protein GGI00_001461 [Coemansia sp. RSA 2681]|nr:hypothetical protein GGI00_001461 [Coemansia sp. RSA 2681]